jgi:hypothetical protein
VPQLFDLGFQLGDGLLEVEERNGHDGEAYPNSTAVG